MELLPAVAPVRVSPTLALVVVGRAAPVLTWPGFLSDFHAVFCTDVVCARLRLPVLMFPVLMFVLPRLIVMLLFPPLQFVP